MADPKHPRHYDEAFKRQIVQSCESGKPSREIRAEYDIARSTPRCWYSHEGRRDTGQRRPLPDIGAMRDTGRSPLRLLLDDRASRSRACGSDRRRRARGPARRPRTPRRQEDQGRPGKEGRHRVQETHRRHHARTGHDGRVRARTVRTAQDAGPTATPRTRIRRAILPMSASAETGRTCVCWSTWRTGASSAIPPGGPGTRAWYWARSPRSTSR